MASRIVFEIPENFHKNLKLFCVKKDMTIKSYILSLISKDLKKNYGNNTDS